MTKEEIIRALNDALKKDATYYIDDKVMEAMVQYPDPMELVDVVLRIIADNPNVDFGMPGDLVRFAEGFYKKGYEEALIASVRTNPTPHNIWMVHRCYRDLKNPLHEEFRILIESIRNDESISNEAKRAIDEFSW